jgi:hypothetical protein
VGRGQVPGAAPCSAARQLPAADAPRPPWRRLELAERRAALWQRDGEELRKFQDGSIVTERAIAEAEEALGVPAPAVIVEHKARVTIDDVEPRPPPPRASPAPSDTTQPEDFTPVIDVMAMPATEAAAPPAAPAPAPEAASGGQPARALATELSAADIVPEPPLRAPSTASKEDWANAHLRDERAVMGVFDRAPSMRKSADVDAEPSKPGAGEGAGPPAFEGPVRTPTPAVEPLPVIAQPPAVFTVDSEVDVPVVAEAAKTDRSVAAPPAEAKQHPTALPSRRKRAKSAPPRRTAAAAAPIPHAPSSIGLPPSIAEVSIVDSGLTGAELAELQVAFRLGPGSGEAGGDQSELDVGLMLSLTTRQGLAESVAAQRSVVQRACLQFFRRQLHVDEHIGALRRCGRADRGLP